MRWCGVQIHLSVFICAFVVGKNEKLLSAKHKNND